MGLNIIIARETLATVIAGERLWLTADKERVVREGDRDAAHLLAGIGNPIPRSVAERYGLLGETSATQGIVAAGVPTPPAEPSVVETPAPPVAEPIADPPAALPPLPDMEGMKLPALRALADERGVDHAGIKRNVDLIAKLEAAAQ